jgi:small-conductance mechanosensitive channel
LVLEFERLCWVRRPEDSGRLTDFLNTGIYNALNEACIKIPFPQQDVYIRSLPEDGRASGHGN